MRPNAGASIALLLIALGADSLQARPSIPAEAANAVKAVNLAASRRDLAALRSAMTEEFIWSFGGDASARQAIDAWRADPRLLTALRDATSGSCEPIGQRYIQCPKDAGVSHRAGFALTSVGWRLTCFVAGD